MKAIIFAAGLGTRLKPLTNDRPKALVELNGKPLLWHAIHKLKEAGISEIVVNVHHFAEKVKDFVASEDWGIPIRISDESDELLETGGGILKARKYLDGNEPFVAYNVDIVTSLNLKKVIEVHKQNKALVTLVVRKRDTSRYFTFDESMRLTGWKNFTSGEEKISLPGFSNSQPFAFSGIHVLSPTIFNLIEESGKFSVVPLYLRLAKQHLLQGFLDESDFWMDLGKPGQIELAEKFLREK